MFIQKSKYLVNCLLCRVIAEKSREVYSVRDFLDRIEAVKGIDTAQQSRMADDTAFHHAPQRVADSLCSDKLQCLCSAGRRCLLYATEKQNTVSSGFLLSM